MLSMLLLFYIILEVDPFKRRGKIYNKLDSVTRDRPILTGKPVIHSRDQLIHSRDRLVTIGGIRIPDGSDSSGNSFT